MSGSKYRLILFDLDNTLFDFDAAEELALEHSLRVNGLADLKVPGGLGRYREVNQRLWAALERGELTQEQVLLGRWEQYLEQEGLDYAAIDRAYLRGLAEHKQLLEGAEAVLRELARRGYILSIVTNGVGWIQRENMARSGIADLIAALVISDEVGAAKPDARIFEAAMAQSGWQDKASTLMVGDSLSSDITGGNAFGLDTCYFNPKGKEHHAAPNFEIRALEELLDLL